jgi:hypothetical protein
MSGVHKLGAPREALQKGPRFAIVARFPERRAIELDGGVGGDDQGVSQQLTGNGLGLKVGQARDHRGRRFGLLGCFVNVRDDHIEFDTDAPQQLTAAGGGRSEHDTGRQRQHEQVYL